MAGDDTPVQVEILSEGDSVNELMLLVGGMVEVLRPGSEECEELTIDLDGHSSIRGGSYNRCGVCSLDDAPHLGLVL
jgi:hypothetical protein